MVRPVVFPPGRASEGMSPIPSMSSLLATMDRRGPLLGDAERKVAGWRNHVDLHSNQLSNEFGKLLGTALWRSEARYENPHPRSFQRRAIPAETIPCAGKPVEYSPATKHQ
jgi:hypothetical protein